MAEAAVSSVILRFRDLNVADGETVARHRDRIATRGATWWGWWAAGSERLADDQLRALAKLARDGLTVLLFDSGLFPGRLFAAQCAEIRWDELHEPIPSPELALTPDYYADRNCLAWLKFTSIEDADAKAIRKFTYVDVPAFFADPETRYEVFDGKRVSSFKELYYQRRTMWFVRRAAAADSDHEVLLIGRDVVEPRDFPDTFIDTPRTRVLWLSDLHFDNRGHHAFPLAKSPNKDPLGAALEREVSRWGEKEFAGLIVSGDLTWRGAADEFDLAENFLRQISDWAGFRAEAQRIGVVPGNHDIGFSAHPEDPMAEVTVAPGEAREAYSAFYANVFHRRPNEFLSSGRRFLLGRSIPVEIAFLNSSLLEQVPEAGPAKAADGRPSYRFQGQGFVGEEQLADAAQQLGWGTVRPGRTIRIAVLHHHLIPVSYSEPAAYGANYSTVLDSGRLTRWLVENRVAIVLHGHQHEPFLARQSRPIDASDDTAGWHSFYILGMGSSGVAGGLPPDTPNVFAVLEFVQADRIEATFWSIDPTVRSRQVAKITIDLAGS